MTSSCPFCEMETDRIFFENQYCFCVRDAYPISDGHSLVISKRHIGSIFDTSTEERSGLLSAIVQAKDSIELDTSPDGYNIAINDGYVAGQTIPHLHIHLIPRYEGDVEDPRGGIRNIFPDKADYWSSER